MRALRFAFGAIALAAGLAGPARAGGTPQDHHCKLGDGTFDGTKTHKQCDAAHGTWAKDAAYTGVIKTGVVAIGGETTGTTLDVAGANQSYELDLHDDAALTKQAGNLSAKQVTVTGYLTTKKGVEIAERKIIVVSTITP
jgi:hypothetical protein